MSEKTEDEETTKSPWLLFGRIFWNPFVLLPLIIVTYLTLKGHFLPEKEGVVKTLLNVLAMLFMGVLGSMVYAKILEFTEKGKLIEKGKSAIRNLKLTQNELGSLQGRVMVFLAREEEDNQPKLTKTNLEEINRNVTSLREQTIASIENWKDVFPEADVKSQIGFYTNKELELQETEKEKAKIEVELEELKKDQQADKNSIEELQQSLDTKTTELDAVKKERDRARASLDHGILSGLDLSSSPHASMSTTSGSLQIGSVSMGLGAMPYRSHGPNICKKCQSVYSPTLNLRGTDSGYCPSCEKTLSIYEWAEREENKP